MAIAVKDNRYQARTSVLNILALARDLMYEMHNSIVVHTPSENNAKNAEHRARTCKIGPAFVRRRTRAGKDATARGRLNPRL